MPTIVYRNRATSTLSMSGIGGIIGFSLVGIATSIIIFWALGLDPAIAFAN